MIADSHAASTVALAALAIGIVAISAAPAAAQRSPVQLAAGGRTIISLPENPTTGYVWRFDAQGSSNAAIVSVDDLGFSRPKSARPLDHDDVGSIRSEVINVIDSFKLERDAGGKPVPTFPHPALVGAPGVHRWSIEGVSTGRARLFFINSRPWEGRPVRQRTIAVEVR